MKVWVVFTGKTDILWLKILKPGFRHCFAFFKKDNHWVTYDPLSSYTNIDLIKVNTDLPHILSHLGETVIETSAIQQHKKAAPIMPYSCVESIKRLLGIHSRKIITPYQLYSYIKERSHG